MHTFTKPILATLLLITGLLLMIILNPVLTYANKTTHNNFDIYHNRALSKYFIVELDKANQLLATSEFKNPKIALDICLNDGSAYAELLKKIRGAAFAWGFYDKVVLQGAANYKDNYIELHGYKWNLTQLLAHEMTHCLQFDKLGLLQSNPIARIPNWKWEGYAEYVARQNDDQKNLIKNIDRLLKAGENDWHVVFADSTIAPKEYYKYWALVKYCMDIKKMTYLQILTDTSSEETVSQEMLRWYHRNTIGRTKAVGQLVP